MNYLDNDEITAIINLHKEDIKLVEEQIRKNFKDKDYELKLKENKINSYFDTKESFFNQLTDNIKNRMHYIASFCADLDTVIYDISEKYLKNKKNPAKKEALRIKDLKQETKEYIMQYKSMKYEYDYLLSLYPELEEFIDVYEEKIVDLQELKDNYDYVKKWVSKEEYENLSENERNQLALERYIENKKKSKWQIGRDYELYIGYLYEKEGFKINYTGIIDNIYDKGRDLIAKNKDKTYIIQCKNWSQEKTIHEKHICQLFGTAKQYEIENNCKVIPVFVTTTKLSETALKFAEYLGVQVMDNKPLAEFPRIKCNISSNGEKIYHLPFDQQYDRTIINKEGELFAWTIEEATEKGFRRAKKYFYN